MLYRQAYESLKVMGDAARSGEPNGLFFPAISYKQLLVAIYQNSLQILQRGLIKWVVFSRGLERHRRGCSESAALPPRRAAGAHQVHRSRLRRRAAAARGDRPFTLHACTVQ